MEHPLIGNLDHLSVDELNTKISDLNNKLAIASRSGNGHLCDQLRMAIESYRSKYQDKMAETYNKKTGDKDFADKINIK